MNTNPECLVGISRTTDVSVYSSEDKVFNLVREAFIAGGLGKKDINIPLKDIVQEGGIVLLKPNWVIHQNLGGYVGDCLVTHPIVIKAVLREVVAAKPSKVIIADAPVQDCHFEKVVDHFFKQELLAICKNVELQIIDLRRAVLASGQLSGGVHSELRDKENYVLFDIGKDSLIEPITTKKKKFRIIKYDHRKLAERHKCGVHKYLMAKEAFTADTVISIPKLKTHKKTGITGPLKNLVGLNGNKDYLPHHRVGGSLLGGDSYPGLWLYKRFAEFFLDLANKCIGKESAERWIFYAEKCLGLHYRKVNKYDPVFEGSWHGNDTCWRMVGDLNRILRYGKADGTLSEEPQRTLHSLTDAIVCGDGDGPLAPQPIFAGLITYSQNPWLAELVHCAILRLNPTKIRLMEGLKLKMRWPIVDSVEGHFFLGNRKMTLSEIALELGVNSKPAPGWDNFVEWKEVRG